MKKCTKCNILKPYESFHKNKRACDGLRSNCKNCESISKSEYYKNNKKLIREKHKKYYKNNKKSFKDRRRLYMRLKRLNDPLFRLRSNISSLISISFTNRGFSKNSSTSEILGCSYEEFKQFLNNNPYGFTINQENIDLDHIIPISSATTEKEVLDLNHYTNFQLLPEFYNRYIKKDKPFSKIHLKNWIERGNKLIEIMKLDEDSGLYNNI